MPRTKVAWPALAALLVAVVPSQASAGQTVREVLSFLLTNRSIATGDFVRDEQAAAATSETIAQLLLTELGTVPVTSSASGFTYRLDPALGVSVRTSDSFGPVFVERSLTSGRGTTLIAVSQQATAFQDIDGRPLRDGTLRSIAAQLSGEASPFDVETVTLRIDTRSTLVSVNVGLTDRLDVGAVVTFLRVAIDGQRVDTYRGTPFLQATGVATASGLGDVIARGKYNLVRNGGSGVAVGVETRLPTGDADNLLGSGRTSFLPRVIGSYERGRFAAHGDAGFALGGFSKEWQYRGAATVVAHPRVTIVGELLGRRPTSSVQLGETTDPHPGLIDVSTIRLTGVPRAAHRLIVVGAARWNIASSWLLTATVLRPLTSVGLNARWVPIVALDYSFGR